MNKKRCRIFFLASFMILLFSFSCVAESRFAPLSNSGILAMSPATNVAKKTKGEAQEQSDIIVSPEQLNGTTISLPQLPQNKKSHFSTIDDSVILQIQMGTVQSFRAALSSLHQADQVYTSEQAVLMNIISAEMRVLYPNEKIQWPIPDATDDMVYMPIIDSVQKGVYDFNAKGKDFFSLTLPSLVLITSPSIKNYYKEAQKSLDNAITINPSSFLAYFLRGVLSYRMENFEMATGFFQKAFEIDGSYNALNEFYANSLIKTGKNDMAASLAEKLLEADPTNVDLLKVSAYSCINEGNWEKAEEYIVRVLQQEPDNPEFILLRAKILMARQDYLNVSLLLDVYAKTNSTSKDYLLLKATLLRDWNKNPSSAASTINEALNLYPNDIDVMLFAASLMISSSQKIGERSSMDLLNEILQRESDNIQAKTLMVTLLVNAEDWKNAYNLSSSLVTKSDCTLDIILMHIKICIKLKNSSECRKVLSILNKMASDKSVYELALVQVLILEGNNNEALRQINSALSKDYSSNTKSNFYYEKSRIAGSDEQKLSDLRSCLTSNPRNPDALFALYQYYFDKKDYRKSQYYIRQAVALNPYNQKLLDLSAQLESLMSE